jgi:integrase
MSYEEEDALLSVMEDERYYNLRLFFQIAINTGMRANEVLGLRWSEIDLEQRQIVLPYHRTKESKDKGVPLNSFVLGLLADRQKECEGMETVFGYGASYPQIGELWRQACQKAEVVNLHIHDLRHTFASRLLARGHRETDINRLLGHASLKMTAKYTHSSVESRREAVESLTQDCHRETGNVRKIR